MAAKRAANRRKATTSQPESGKARFRAARHWLKYAYPWESELAEIQDAPLPSVLRAIAILRKHSEASLRSSSNKLPGSGPTNLATALRSSAARREATSAHFALHTLQNLSAGLASHRLRRLFRHDPEAAEFLVRVSFATGVAATKMAVAAARQPGSDQAKRERIKEILTQALMAIRSWRKESELGFDAARVARRLLLDEGIPIPRKTYPSVKTMTEHFHQMRRTVPEAYRVMKSRRAGSDT